MSRWFWSNDHPDLKLKDIFHKKFLATSSDFSIKTKADPYMHRKYPLTCGIPTLVSNRLYKLQQLLLLRAKLCWTGKFQRKYLGCHSRSTDLWAALNLKRHKGLRKRFWMRNETFFSTALGFWSAVHRLYLHKTMKVFAGLFRRVSFYWFEFWFTFGQCLKYCWVSKKNCECWNVKIDTDMEFWRN